MVPRTSLVNSAAASVSLIRPVRISAGQLSGSASHSGPFKHKLATWLCHSLCSLHLRGSGQCSHVFIGNVVLFLYLAYSVSNKLLVDTASSNHPQTVLMGWSKRASFTFATRFEAMCSITSSSLGIINPFFATQDFAASKPWFVPGG